MSQINVTTIRNRTGGPPELDKGVVVTGIVTATTGNITGNLTVGGSVTYEDVTNVDSVGVVTAGKGFRATTGGLIVTAGVVTATGGVNVSGGELVVGDIYPPTYEPVSNTQAWIHGDFDGAGTGLQVGNGSGAGSSDESAFIHLTPMSGGKGVLCQSDREGTYSSAAASSASFNLQLNSENSWVERLKITPKGGFLLSNGILVERCKIVTTAWSTTNDISLDDGNVFLNTANLAGTNNFLDITSSNGISNDLAVGDMTSVTCITAVNAATAYIDAITVGGANVTESWVGGSVPTDGGSSGYDVYTFNIIKTSATPTYVVIANQVKGS